MTPERFKRLSDVLDKRQPDLTVIADEVHKGRNIAAILRTCDAVGIDQIHSVQPAKEYHPFRGTALGTEKWVRVNLYDSLQEPVELCKKTDMQIIVTALSDDAIDFREVDYTKPTALILGAEDCGVSDLSQALADIKVTIPMVGMVESFNVSVACAVILSEAQRQRSLKHLYDLPRIDENTRKQRFFEWAHPKVTEFCCAKNIPYPEVDEEGEIINGAQWYHSNR